MQPKYSLRREVQRMFRRFSKGRPRPYQDRRMQCPKCGRWLLETYICPDCGCNAFWP